jgi:co-chaperonin GroES (HSP10)
MKAVGKFILINKIDEDVKTDFNLMLGETSKMDIRYLKGKVVHVGHEVDPVIKENDIVFYDKSQGYSMLTKGKMITVIRERDVVLIEDN